MLLLFSQSTVISYSDVKNLTKAEIPMGEAADEDPDNESEEDKLIQHTNIENTDLSYAITHPVQFKSNTTDLIAEIVPPPPKA
jgi:hypothetical protein